MSPIWLLTLYCGAILLVSSAGGLLPLLGRLSHTQLQLYLSFAAGVMLGTGLFHMLPEALDLTSQSATLNGVALGLLALFLVERFFSSHHHEEPFAKGRAPLSWSAAAVGMSLHTLGSGVALASAVVAGQPELAGGLVGVGVFFAIVLHKPADSLTVVTLVLSAGASRRRAHLVNLLFAAIVPAGAILFFAARTAVGHEAPARFTGNALAFSTGMFLSIALSDLLPELHFHHHDRVKLSISLLMGVGLMFAASLLENYNHQHPSAYPPPHTEGINPSARLPARLTRSLTRFHLPAGEVRPHDAQLPVEHKQVGAPADFEASQLLAPAGNTRRREARHPHHLPQRTPR